MFEWHVKIPRNSQCRNRNFARISFGVVFEYFWEINGYFGSWRVHSFSGRVLQVLDALVSIGCARENWMHSWVLDALVSIGCTTRIGCTHVLDAFMNIGCTHEYWMHPWVLDALVGIGCTREIGCTCEYWMHSWGLDALVSIGRAHESWSHLWVLDALVRIECTREYWMHSCVLDALLRIGCTREYWIALEVLVGMGTLVTMGCARENWLHSWWLHAPMSINWIHSWVLAGLVSFAVDALKTGNDFSESEKANFGVCQDFLKWEIWFFSSRIRNSLHGALWALVCTSQFFWSCVLDLSPARCFTKERREIP